MSTILRVEDLPNIPQLTSGALFYTSQSGNPYNVSYLQINANITGGGGGGGNITNNFFVNSGSGLFLFQTPILSGLSGQFINFPTPLTFSPVIVNSLQNNNIGDILLYQISGVTSAGYWINFSDVVNDTGYVLNTYAANSSGTGLATIVIVNNIVPTGSEISLITGLSGCLNQTGSILYNDIVGLSGKLNSTGQILQIQISNISNSLTIISGGIGVTGVNSITGGVNLIGQGNITITQNGQNINISGASGGVAVVPSINFSTNINWAAANTFYTTISNATVTFTFANNIDGQTIVVKTAMNNTGLIIWPSNVKWPNSNTPISSSGATDVYTFVQINTGIYATVIQNFSYP